MLAVVVLTFVSLESTSININVRGGGLLTTKRNKFSHDERKSKRTVVYCRSAKKMTYSRTNRLARLILIMMKV